MAASQDHAPSILPPRTEHGRVFVELATRGCGVGCKYCYISAPADPVEPVAAADLREVLRNLENTHLGAGAGPPLLAIGCDTEVGLDPRITDNAVACLTFAAKYRLAVQFATKFPLPRVVLDSLDSWPEEAPVPVVFTTITTITRSHHLEPGAPPAEERARNFTTPRHRWVSYGLVKPFHRASADDADDLVALFTRTSPDGVVVGAQYRRVRPNDHAPSSYQHPFASDWISNGLTRQATTFTEKLNAAGVRTFYSTRCVTAWHNSSAHGKVISEQYPHLCTNCGAC